MPDHSSTRDRLSVTLRYLRTAAWHVRHGGISQWRKWRSRQHIVSAAADGRAVATQGQSVTFAPAVLPDRPPRRADLRVAVILDEFSLLAWSYEFEVVPVTPQTWHTQLAEQPIDLLLVESAWHGNSDAWQYQLTGPHAPSPALRALVEHCREARVPTVFWNKEDPPHFEDFLDTAKLFDHVFTTDVTLLPRYRAELEHERVDVLPFAAQSAVHNPVRPQHGYQERDVAFAGMYFAHKFPERRAQMDLLLGGALDASTRMEHGLEIFSRFLGDDTRYQYPATLADRVVGSLEYPRMLTAYKAYKVFLNVNSVTTSPSMCARRIFEITASGTPVISAPSPAVSEFFPDDEVPVVGDREGAAQAVRAMVRSPQLRDRIVHRAQRRIWREHTYTHRARSILAAVGLDADTVSAPMVSVLAVTNRPAQLEHLLRQISHQRDVEVELVLVTHGFETPSGTTETANELGIDRIQTFHAPADWSLGHCLNVAVARSEGSVLAKMDDDDLYGPLYLHDLLHALDYSGADVVGKQAHHLHLEDSDATLLRFPWREHRWTDRVMGPTITGHRRVFEAHPFPDVSLGEDTAFLQSVCDDGGRIYSTDRFNFIQQRGRVRTHSWVADDRELLATADLVWWGTNEVQVMT